MTVWVLHSCEDGFCSTLDCFDSAEKAYDKVYELITYPIFDKTYIKEGLDELKQSFSQNPRSFSANEYEVEAMEVH